MEGKKAKIQCIPIGLIIRRPYVEDQGLFRVGEKICILEFMVQLTVLGGWLMHYNI